MKNLYDPAVYAEIKQRLSVLQPGAQRVWGKMTVAQMLAHCKRAFRVPLSERQPPKLYPFALFGWLLKKKLYDDVPWKRGLPTAPAFIIKDDRDFEKERTALMELVQQFYEAGPARAEKIIHPVFGRFTGEQWGQAMYKHLNHHLEQFGA
jgi:hypothetical protein